MQRNLTPPHERTEQQMSNIKCDLLKTCLTEPTSLDRAVGKSMGMLFGNLSCQQSISVRRIEPIIPQSMAVKFRQIESRRKRYPVPMISDDRIVGYKVFKMSFSMRCSPA